MKHFNKFCKTKFNVNYLSNCFGGILMYPSRIYFVNTEKLATLNPGARFVL